MLLWETQGVDSTVQQSKHKEAVLLKKYANPVDKREVLVCGFIYLFSDSSFT